MNSIHEKNVPILFYPKFVFYIVGILPLVVYSIVLYRYLFYFRREDLITFVPIINDVILHSKLRMFFGVYMTISCWLLLPVYIIIYKVLKICIRKVNKEKPVIALKILNVFHGLTFFSLLGFCSITLEENYIFHCTCYFIFAVSIFLSFLLIEFLMEFCKMNVKVWHRVWTLLIPFFNVLSFILYRYNDKSMLTLSFVAIFQYLSGILKFGKYILYCNIFPDFGVIIKLGA